MFAVDECHKDIVQRLVSAGADVHIRDKVCGDMVSVCQMLHVASSKWVWGNHVYNSIHVCEPCIYTQMIYCVRFHGPDHVLGLHMCMRKGKGREGHYIWFMRLMYT